MELDPVPDVCIRIRSRTYGTESGSDQTGPDPDQQHCKVDLGHAYHGSILFMQALVNIAELFVVAILTLYLFLGRLISNFYFSTVGNFRTVLNKMT
jgi:hypothetical protein